MEFSGAKIVLLIGDGLVTLLRDNRPDIDQPDRWDMPGGGREPGETAQETVLRELEEELGLVLAPADLVWSQVFARGSGAPPAVWFAARLPARAVAEIRLGDEGQGWAIMPPADWLAHPKSIARFEPAVRAGLAALGALGS